MKFLSIAAGDYREPGELDSYIGVKLTLDGSYLVGDASNYGTWTNLIPSRNPQSVAMTVIVKKVYVLSWDLATDLKSVRTDKLAGTADDVRIKDNSIQSDSITLDITCGLN